MSAERTKDLKRRVRRLEENQLKIAEKIDELAGLNVIMEVQSQQELQTLLVIAAQHNMLLPEYVRSCMLKISNEYLDRKKEAEEAEAAKKEREETFGEELSEKEEENAD